MTGPNHPEIGRADVLSVLTGRVGAVLPDYGLTVVDHLAGAIVVPGSIGEPGAPVRVAIRAGSVALSVGRPGAVSIRTALAGEVVRIESGPDPIATVSVRLTGGEMLRAAVTRLAIDALGLSPGLAVQALVKVVAVGEFVAPAAGGSR